MYTTHGSYGCVTNDIIYQLLSINCQTIPNESPKADPMMSQSFAADGLQGSPWWNGNVLANLPWTNIYPLKWQCSRWLGYVIVAWRVIISFYLYWTNIEQTFCTENPLLAKLVIHLPLIFYCRVSFVSKLLLVYMYHLHILQGVLQPWWDVCYCVHVHDLRYPCVKTFQAYFVSI